MSALVKAADVSNWSAPDVTQLVKQYGLSHVVVRASTENQQFRDIARRQLATAIQAGASVSIYVWCYWTQSPAEHTANALSVADGFPVDLVWFDTEGWSADGQLDHWLSQAVSLTESRGKRAGVYSGQPWWVENGNSQGFSRLPLWCADWTNEPNLDPPSLGWFGGWTKLAGRQYSGGDVDLNVFDQTVIAPDACARIKSDLQAIISRKPYRAPSRKRLADILAS